MVKGAEWAGRWRSLVKLRCLGAPRMRMADSKAGLTHAAALSCFVSGDGGPFPYMYARRRSRGRQLAWLTGCCLGVSPGDRVPVGAFKDLDRTAGRSQSEGAQVKVNMRKQTSSRPYSLARKRKRLASARQKKQSEYCKARTEHQAEKVEGERRRSCSSTQFTHHNAKPQSEGRQR